MVPDARAGGRAASHRRAAERSGASDDLVDYRQPRQLQSALRLEEQFGSAPQVFVAARSEQLVSTRYLQHLHNLTEASQPCSIVPAELFAHEHSSSGDSDGTSSAPPTTSVRSPVQWLGRRPFALAAISVLDRVALASRKILVSISRGRVRRAGPWRCARLTSVVISCASGLHLGSVRRQQRNHAVRVSVIPPAAFIKLHKWNRCLTVCRTDPQPFSSARVRENARDASADDEAPATVNFVVSGFHWVWLYNAGVRLAQVKENIPATGTFVNYNVNVFAKGVDPGTPPTFANASVNPSGVMNRTDSFGFSVPGRYLVICNVRGHLLDGMYAWIDVIDGDRGDGDDD
jgi:hypothetical protein